MIRSAVGSLEGSTGKSARSLGSTKYERLGVAAFVKHQRPTGQQEE